MVRLMRQNDVSDCGAVCLVSILSHYGCDVSVASARLYAGTNQTGTTVAGIITAADRFGFSARAVRLTLPELAGAPQPTVAHVTLESGLHHYVVVTRAGPESIEAMDPQDGKIRRYSPVEFNQTWTGVLITLEQRSTAKPPAHRRNALARLLLLLRPYWFSGAAAVVASGVISVMAMVMSVYVQKVVDAATGSDTYNGAIAVLARVMIVILFARVSLTAGQAIWTSLVGWKVDSELTSSYYKHLFALPQSFFDTIRIGEVLSRNDDAIKVREVFSSTAGSMLIGAGTLLGALAGILFVNFTLGLLSATVVALYLAILATGTAVTKRFKVAILEDIATYDARLVESLSLVSTIKRFSLEQIITADLRHLFSRLLNSSFRLDVYNTSASSLATVVVEGFVIVMLWVGTDLALAGALTPGKLMLCYTLIGFITSSAQSVLRGTFAMQDASIAARRMFEWLDLDPELDPGIVSLTRRDCSSLRFNDVSFQYPGRRPVLNRVAFRVEAGSLVVITGPSGTGKTTLLSLLLRLYYPTSGTIYIGDNDIRLFTLESLRTHVAAMSQTVGLFSRSITENIAPAEPKPNMARIEEICERLGLAEFIRSLPNGLSTKVEEGGSNFSGGQRQRLAIARVLYPDAPIIVLDEPTASLDAGAEDKIVEMIEYERGRGKILAVVSHADAIIGIADEVISITDGVAYAAGAALHNRSQP
jgi:ABC-type bacteriocin/lantibiotic exporter with double-glycine peptidase domain